MENKPKRNKCDWCGNIFFTENWRNQKFCSLSCAGKYGYSKSKDKLSTFACRKKISNTITKLHQTTEFWKNELKCQFLRMNIGEIL